MINKSNYKRMMFMVQTKRRSLASLSACLPCVFQGKFFITSAICNIRKRKKLIIAVEFFVVLHSKSPSCLLPTFLEICQALTENCYLSALLVQLLWFAFLTPCSFKTICSLTFFLVSDRWMKEF